MILKDWKEEKDGAAIYKKNKSGEIIHKAAKMVGLTTEEMQEEVEKRRKYQQGRTRKAEGG